MMKMLLILNIKEDKKFFNKLVRDNIIEKITNNGEFVSFGVLDDMEYKREL